MNTIAEVLAANIRTRRKEIGLTQEQLAERTGLSTTTIQQLERKEKWLGTDSVAALAKGLDTSEMALFQTPIDVQDCAKRVLAYVNQLSKK